MVAQCSDMMKLKHAKQIARDGGCFIVEIPHTNKAGEPQTKYLLYREASPRNQLVGKRMNVGSILALAKKATNYS